MALDVATALLAIVCRARLVAPVVMLWGFAPDGRSHPTVVMTMKSPSVDPVKVTGVGIDVIAERGLNSGLGMMVRVLVVTWVHIAPAPAR